MKARTLLAFLVAPAMLPAFVLSLAAAVDPSRESIQAGVAYAALLSVFTYGVAIACGIPLSYWYRRRGWHGMHHYAIAGAVLGMLPLIFIAQFGRIPLALPPVLAAIGCVSALAFLGIAVRQSARPNEV
jgi:hypothetical protein